MTGQPCQLLFPQISAESVALWINTVVGASTLFGLWALGILFRQARLHLKEQNMQAKFTCFQVSQQLTEHLKHEESSSLPERGSVTTGRVRLSC